MSDSSASSSSVKTNEPKGTADAARDDATSMGKSSVTPKGGRDPLLAAICHDLRAPLAAVTMGANFVLQTTSDDESSARQRRILEAMLRSCAQMERLVRNFADLSEIEGGAVTLRMGLHDAGEMLDLTAEAANESARTKKVTLELQKPEFAIAMRCDRERVLRALGHLVENAVKFAPEGSVIELSVAADEGNAAFKVVDHGPGITNEVRKNLFDREWHAKRASRVGSGFGLAIVRGFASAHEGKILVESELEKQTTFTLSLPVNGPQDEGTPVPSSARAFSTHDDDQGDDVNPAERASTGKGTKTPAKAAAAAAARGANAKRRAVGTSRRRRP